MLGSQFPAGALPVARARSENPPPRRRPRRWPTTTERDTRTVVAALVHSPKWTVAAFALARRRRRPCRSLTRSRTDAAANASGNTLARTPSRPFTRSVAVRSRVTSADDSADTAPPRRRFVMDASTSLEDPMRRVKERWRAARDELRAGLITRDDVDFAVDDDASDPTQIPNPKPNPKPNPNPNPKRPLRLVAGVDVSYRREFIYDSTHRSETAVACLAVLRFPELTPEWVDFEEFAVDAPYVPGFLAFRECPAMTTLLRRCPPGAKPDVVLVDGNGALHPEGFGLACHVGVECGVPTVGVAKDLHAFDGLDAKSARAACDDAVEEAARGGGGGAGVVATGGYPALWPDAVALVGASGTTHGAALFGHEHSGDGAGCPLYVSGGHRVSLALALAVARACRAPGRKTPEPIRVADARSRARVRLLEGKAP